MMKIPLERLQAIATQQPHPLLFATISGAHLYGFPSPDSDYDLRGVHILPVSQVVGLELGKDTIECSEQQPDLELDLVTHDIHKFFQLLLRRNGYVLEQLFSPLVIQTTPEHEELKAIAPTCITRHHNHHYLGFAHTQWKLLSKEEPPRVKPLLYLYRVLLTGIHLMQTGKIEANLVTLNEEFQLAYIPDLIAQKLAGEQQFLAGIDRDFHQQEYTRLCAELETAGKESFLPEESGGRRSLHDLLLRVRLAHL